MPWTTPDDLKEQVRKRWNRGDILAARLTGEPLFPLRLRLAKPSTADVTENFDQVRCWVQRLMEGSRERCGFGYEIEWREIHHRVHGTNRLPDGIMVPTEGDALRMILRNREASLFSEHAEATLALFPELGEWLAQRPLCLLKHAADWPRILAVLTHFRLRPRPGVYLRQLEIENVDTKFIENHKGLLAELLDRVLPDGAITWEANGARSFERRYGLLCEPPLVRFRLLDSRLAIRGLMDISVPPEAFAELALPVERAYITENKINGLAFPEVPGALVIFGLGYGLERLVDVDWLRRTELYYWGDIDTHGFAILDRLRAGFPRARSLLMDRVTLEIHRRLWGQEPLQSRFTGVLQRLAPDELALFEDLKHDRLGERIRLEQERIDYGWIRRVIGH